MARAEMVGARGRIRGRLPRPSSPHGRPPFFFYFSPTILFKGNHPTSPPGLGKMWWMLREEVIRLRRCWAETPGETWWREREVFCRRGICEVVLRATLACCRADPRRRTLQKQNAALV